MNKSFQITIKEATRMDRQGRQRKQSQILERPCQKLFNEPQFSIDNEQIDQQETARIRMPQGSASFRKMTYSGSKNQSEEEGEITESIIQLTNEIRLKNEALERATQIIQMLTEDNNSLKEQLSTCQQQYQRISQQYKKVLENCNQQIHCAEQTIRDLQQKSTKNESMILGSITGGRTGRYTPIKLYNKNDEEDYLQPLTQIEKELIVKRISDLEMDLQGIEEMVSTQNSELYELQDQQKYIEAYLEDELLNIQIGNKNSMDQWQLSEVLQKYESCIRYWQEYANSLKLSLIESIQFIQNMWSDEKIVKARQTALNGCELAEYICRKSVNLLYRKLQKKQKQNEELRSLIEELINKVSKKHL